MNVATLRLEITRQFHLRTLKISAGTSIFMSPLTLTWHARRQPRRASPGEMKPVSVGSRSPPPSLITTSQTPQAPFPPQADGMKILLSARAPRRVPPAGVFSVLSSLIRIDTSPVATSLRRAPSSNATSSSTTPVNMKTARTMSSMVSPSELDAGEHHERERHQAGDDERDPEALQSVRHVRICHLF